MLKVPRGLAKEPNIIRGGTPYLSQCDATYVAPPAGGNAVDVSGSHRSAMPMAGPMALWKSSGNHCAFFVSRRMKDWAGCIIKVPLGTISKLIDAKKDELAKSLKITNKIYPYTRLS